MYPASKKKFDKQIFQNPPSEYRGTPFWSWNGEVTAKVVKNQLPVFDRMGMGGATIHCRTGLATPYMGETYMQRVSESLAWAEANDKYIWLYDEDRWPSGYGGGLVTEDVRYRARHLLWTTVPYEASSKQEVSVHKSTAGVGRCDNGELKYVYDVELDADGLLKSYKRIDPLQQGSRPKRGVRWYAYLEVAPSQSWFNYQSYVDTLNKSAIERFIEVTHEKYKQHFKRGFGKTMPVIFTDEPQFTHKHYLKRSGGGGDLVIPFTNDFPLTFEQTYGKRLEDHLPELFWELPEGQVSVIRYWYHDHVCERFSRAFAATIGQWCRENGIALTGHMMEEPTLASQTGALGEAMRSLSHFQLPGIDVLCDHHPETTGHPIEFTTAKQAQSVARQYGRPGVMSEIYGVTNWDLPFSGYKAQGDWQAALGVTSRVQHLSLMTLAGEAKRDFPASIFYQTNWCDDFKTLEDHFARLNAVLTRGKPSVRVGVLHPVESYWLCFGPWDKTSEERRERDQNFEDLTRWLVHGLVDYDYISESLLPEQSDLATIGEAGLPVGKMKYQCVIVPSMRTLRATTLDRLEALEKAGGRVIFAGEIPSLVDAVPSGRAASLARRCRCVMFSERAILNELNDVRELAVVTDSRARVRTLAAQVRDENQKTRYVFICNTHRGTRIDDGFQPVSATVCLRGSWEVERLDTMTGDISPIVSEYVDGWTRLPWELHPMDSLLLRLTRQRRKSVRQLQSAVLPVGQEVARLTDPVRVKLSEPNVLLLDIAEWRTDHNPWQSADQVLRLDNKVREQFGLGPKDYAVAQPWSDREPSPVLGRVSLRFKITSDVVVKGAKLALEHRRDTQVWLNGNPVTTRKAGWWVDEQIECIRMPELPAGVSELRLEFPYHRKLDIEAVYLLGNFGVSLHGRHARIIAPVRKLAFGDWTRQGLPFYVGNVTYECKLPQSCKGLALAVPHFRGAFLKVMSNRMPSANVISPPYRITLPSLKKGDTLSIQVIGNRFNMFGNLHCSSRHHWMTLASPGGFRTEAEEWADEYQIRPMGVLVAPMLMKSGK